MYNSNKLFSIEYFFDKYIRRKFREFSSAFDTL